MKFRKKPVVINAWKVRAILEYAEKYWKELPQEIKEGYERGEFIFTPDGIHVKTLEGVHIIGKDGMLIQGVKGEFYGCRQDIFDVTYEEVN